MGMYCLSLGHKDTHNLVRHISLNDGRRSAHPLRKVDRQLVEVGRTQSIKVNLVAVLIQQVEDHTVFSRRRSFKELHSYLRIPRRHVEGVGHTIRQDHMGVFHAGGVEGQSCIVAGHRSYCDRHKLILNAPYADRRIITVDGPGGGSRSHTNGGLVPRVIGTVTAAGHHVQSDGVPILLHKPNLNDHMIPVGGHVESHGLIAVHDNQVRVQKHQTSGSLSHDLRPVSRDYRDIQCNIIIPPQAGQQIHTGLRVRLTTQKCGIPSISAVIQHPHPGSQVIPCLLEENGDRNVVIGHSEGICSVHKGIKRHNSGIRNLPHLHQIGGIAGIRPYVQRYGFASLLPYYIGSIGGSGNAAHAAGKISTADCTACYQSDPMISRR